ncbi:acyl-CoA dehydrogenase family protein [Streptomyces decoyicus]|uniref:acyl-CoA dehydrogenase family protein n=1 Tax=Streptomyces decoyicus TaxID=249567 RepID=UPI0036497B68
MSPTSPLTTAGSSAVSEAVARTLFGPDDAFATVHEPWRQMLEDPALHYEPSLTPAERIAESYRRLHLVQSRVGSPLELASDPQKLSALHEWLAVPDTALTSVASIHHNLVLGSLAEHYDADRDLEDLFALRTTGVFLTTEVAAGCDAAALETTAHRDPQTGEFTLHTPGAGAQKFMPNSSLIGGPKTAVVAARLIDEGQDHGPFLFVVPLTNAEGPLPGIRIRQLGERIGQPLDHSLTSFDQVQLPPNALLQADHGRFDADGTFTSQVADGRKRFLRAIARVTPGKVAMSAATCGISRAALAIAVRYAHHRHISAPDGTTVPIAAHTSHHERLINHLADTYAMTLLTRQTTKAWVERDENTRSAAEREVAITKAWVTWTGRTVVTEMRERCGAHGMLALNGLAHHAGNVDGAITAEGDNLAISVKAAAEMLRQPPAPGRTVTVASIEDASLYDLHDLLTIAQTLAHRRAHDRLHETTEHGLPRWNAACLPALDAVATYAVCRAAGAFLEAIEACDDPRARVLLEELAGLFLLREVERRAGVLMAHGHLEAEAVRQLPDAIDLTIARLAPHMLVCTDAFRVPEAYLASIPIANSDYQLHYDDPQAHWHTESREQSQAA